jgi:hypothetical protein
VLRGLGVDLARLRDSAISGPIVAAPPVAPEPEPADGVPTDPPPRCPSCGADLDGNLVATNLTAAPTGSSVAVVSCRACGAALGLLGG